jgi:hypothetical protein
MSNNSVTTATAAAGGKTIAHSNSDSNNSSLSSYDNGSRSRHPTSLVIEHDRIGYKSPNTPSIHHQGVSDARIQQLHKQQLKLYSTSTSNARNSATNAHVSH